VRKWNKQPIKPRPSAHVIGALDDKLLQQAGIASFPLDESAVASDAWLYQSSIKNSLALLRLKNEFKFQKLSGASSFRYNTPTDTGTTHEYDLLIVEGMRHEYPNGGEARFQMAEVFWNFMKRYQR
jgi:hypothetical protein